MANRPLASRTPRSQACSKVSRIVVHDGLTTANNAAPRGALGYERPWSFLYSLAKDATGGLGGFVPISSVRDCPSARVTANIWVHFRHHTGEEACNTLKAWTALLFSVLRSPLSLAENALSSIYNYHSSAKRSGVSGQPSPSQFADIRAAGFDVVLNLAMPTSENALAEEGRLVSETGMTYVHIPVPWEAPSPDTSSNSLLWWTPCAPKAKTSGYTAPQIIALPLRL